jgi:hypothetical protein
MTLTDMIEQCSAAQHHLARMRQEFPQLADNQEYRALECNIHRVLETMMQMRRGYMTPSEVAEFQKQLDGLRNGAI